MDYINHPFSYLFKIQLRRKLDFELISVQWTDYLLIPQIEFQVMFSLVVF